jgi:diguanylate cyclase (GGDEF)-like protein
MITSIPQLLEFIGAQLRQDKLGRSAFVCWVSIPPYVILALWAASAQLAISPVFTSGLTLIAAFSVASILLMGALGALRYLHWIRAHAECYSYLVLACYTLVVTTACYLLGTLNLITGLAMMAAPTMGMILFPPRLILGISLLSLIALLTLSVLAALELIPYAPGLGIGFDITPNENLFITVSMILAASGYVAYQAIIFMALINAWHLREAEVRKLSATDALTGVANRRDILERLEGMIFGRQRRQDRIALLMLDIDHFKQINDVHGHVTGDEALVAVATRLRDCLREQDVIGRYGGEEFLVILPGTDQHEAAEIAERCRKAVAAIVLHSPQGDVPLTASIGVVSRILQGGDDIDELIRLSDDAMYEAKRAGRNCVKIG